MRVYTYGSASPGYVTQATAKWTLTGWGQTVLRGDVTETTTGGVTTTTLVVEDGVYRQFSADLNVNPQEDFTGTVYTEVVSYQTTTAVASIGAGTVFTVNLKSTKVCDDFYLDGTTLEKATECAALANAKASTDLKMTTQISYASVYYNSAPTQRYTCEIYSVTNDPVLTVSSSGSSSYLCAEIYGSHRDVYETATASPVVYNRYGRFHINKYGYLTDPNGVLLLGKKEDLVTKGALHIPSRWNRILISNFGIIYAMDDMGGLQTVGQLELVRFTNEHGLGLYGDSPILSQCSGQNSLGFALGSWCEGTDLDGLPVWYYVESASSGDPIFGTPGARGLGHVIQYSLATNAKDIYVGGAEPTI